MVKQISSVLAIIIFLVTLFGVCIAIVMNHEMSVMGDCLHITSRSVVCPMGLIEHLDDWKGIMITQPMKLFMALLVVVLAVGSFFVSRNFDAARASPKRLWRERILLALFLPLKRAFSRGILHPKIHLLV